MSSPSEAITFSIPPARAGQKQVVKDLALFGPETQIGSVGLNQALKYCKSLAQSHYENFSVASFLVPATLRQDLYNIYSFCRWADDLADEVGDSQESIRLLDWWRVELKNCFSGKSRHPVYVALSATIAKHSLPLEPFENLIDAFLQDQHVSRYETELQLLGYCRGSADPVGRILLKLAGVHSIEAIRLSDRVCTGLQIANFCQDIRPDALNNRIYLPKERWRRFHVLESEILSGKTSHKLESTIKEWVLTARSHLIDGLPLVRLTPGWLARDVQLFVRGGLTLLDNIARNGFNVWDRPIEVTRKQKLTLLIQSIFRPRSVNVPPLAMPLQPKNA